MPVATACFNIHPVLSTGKRTDKENNKLNVIATIFPVYDFARNIGGDKINVKMLLPPGIDAHHYELRPEDIVKVTKADIFLFTNFELEQWAYKIIKAADKNTNMLAIETGSGTVLMPLNKETQKKTIMKITKRTFPDLIRISGWIWITRKRWWIISRMLLSKKIPATAIITKKTPMITNSNLWLWISNTETELSGCKTKTILHAGHSAFAYLAKRYNLQYIAVYNVFADAEPSPQKIFTLIEQIKNEKVPYVYYEDMINPRLAQTIARETGAGLLKLNNGHDIRKKDLDKGESFISIMENNLTNLEERNEMPEEIIRVDDLTFCYNGTEVISDISLSVRKGDYLGIAGSNGSGKSTLIKNILGILQPLKGTINIFGQPLSSFNQWHRIGYLPQRVNALNYHFPGTVSEIVQLGIKKSDQAGREKHPCFDGYRASFHESHRRTVLR